MSTEIIRTGLLAISLLFIGYISLRNSQDKSRNWAFFYASLYVFVALPIVNFICVSQGLWHFTDSDLPSILMPFDIYFIWGIVWGIIPALFLKKKHMLIVLLVFAWLDILLMPILEQYGLLVLNNNWLIGELALILFVLLPGYTWAYCSFHNKYTWLRALLQVITMVGVFIIGLPFLLYTYGMMDSLDFSMHSVLFQFLLIVSFPALVAVIDLVQVGRGTPFPYDKTSELVTSGVYAYIRNPIQWSFTFIFIPLAIYHHSWFLLLGSLISIAYTIGVSDIQEYPDMEKRFGNRWQAYRENVPKWYFSWKPNNISDGTIYFDNTCNQCTQISTWFSNKNAQNLSIRKASDYHKKTLHKVMYEDYLGNEYFGVAAIAHAFNHINLAFACLGWFMRFPIIRYLLDAIVYSMDFGKPVDCEVKTN